METGVLWAVSCELCISYCELYITIQTRLVMFASRNALKLLRSIAAWFFIIPLRFDSFRFDYNRFHFFRSGLTFWKKIPRFAFPSFYGKIYLGMIFRIRIRIRLIRQSDSASNTHKHEHEHTRKKKIIFSFWLQSSL